MSRTRPSINIHPSTLSPTTLKTHNYDVIVIGGGPGGEMTASRLVANGLTSLLIESELVGGECPYWACVPSKALLRPSETVEAGKAVGGAKERLAVLREKYGVKNERGVDVEVDLEGMWKRRDMFAKDWVDEVPVKQMLDAGVDVVHGFGSLLGVKKVGIRDWHSGETVEIEAKFAVVIATGSAPVIPKIDGLEGSNYWIPRDAVSAREVPEHLVVLGAGAVGVELATVYRQMGSKVTLIGRKVLPKMVPEAGKMVYEGMARAGVDVRIGEEVAKVSREGKSVKVTLKDGATVEGTELLIATGRTARTHGMKLDTVSGPNEGAWVEVDDSMCATSVPDGWLYAVGDPNGRALMTHVSKYQAKIAANTILAKAKGTYRTDVAHEPFSTTTSKPSNIAIPQGVFTDPQVASVGLTPSLATSLNIKTRTISTKMSGPGTWLHAEGYQGWAQWVIEESTHKLLGATFVGRDVVDLVHASTVAIIGGLTTEQLWHAIPPFPTMSEVYTSLSEALESQ